jgi:hypothetical protein
VDDSTPSAFAVERLARATGQGTSREGVAALWWHGIIAPFQGLDDLTGPVTQGVALVYDISPFQGLVPEKTPSPNGARQRRDTLSSPPGFSRLPSC